MRVEVISPHGFCAGVESAVKKALALGSGAFCLHEPVHNDMVTAALRRRGAGIADDPGEVPPGATMILPAHGVAPRVRREAEARGVKIVDATCPFVERVHRAARAFAEKGLPVVIIGDAGHDEVAGIVGEVEDCGGRAFVYPDLPPSGGIGVVCQTTAGVDCVARTVRELRGRYAVEVMAEVCGVTRERQRAVKEFKGDALLVLGSARSANSRRLCEIAPCRAFMASDMAEVSRLDLSGVETLGVTSGASTPEDFFNEAVEFLKEGCKEER